MSEAGRILRTVEPTEGLRESSDMRAHEKYSILLEVQGEEQAGGDQDKEDGENQGGCFSIQRRKDGTQTGIVAMGWERSRDVRDWSRDHLKEG